MATVVIRDLSIADRTRWATNERAQASRTGGHSPLCRVSVRSLRLPTTTSGRLRSTLTRTLGTRTSTQATPATRTTTLRRMATMFGLFGGRTRL